MWRLVTSTFVALTFTASIAAAQQPCTSDAGRVVSEIYRHTMERGVDPGAQHWQNQLANGQMNVREVVRAIAKSDEYMNRFGKTEAGEGMPYERAVARLYRHILSRQPDPQGQRDWAMLAQQSGLGAVVDALINSDEYNRNFGDWGVPGSGGVTFCQPSNFSSSNQSAPAPAQVASGNIRYQGMDRNRDGVVSRSEWRGSDRSFRVHDWNNDGVLSGDEVRGARDGRTIEDEDFDRNDQFAYLDVNNNNRIERREWHGSDYAFAQLDVDRNGVLSHQEYHGADDNRGGAVATSGDLIVVSAREQWVDTGIDVRAGDRITINAEGSVVLSNNPGDTATATGTPSGRRAANAPVRNAPAGGLIARIGNGSPVYVGDQRGVRAPSSGRLYLSVNDDDRNDNQGELRVTVDVQ